MKNRSILFTVFILVLSAIIVTGSITLIKHKRNRIYLNKYHEANTLLNDAKYEEALKIFKSIYPKFKGEGQIEIVYGMGVCYQKTGRADKAEECWQEILDSPYLSYHPFAYYELAQQKTRENNFEQAEVYYSKITGEFPSHPVAEKAMLGPVDIYVAKGEFGKAKGYCENIIESLDSLKVKETAIDKLGQINLKLLFSRDPTEISKFYYVETGDTLSHIAKRFNTTVALIEKSNNLRSTVIRPGQKLKITPADKFSILIDIKKNELFLNYDIQLFKRYKIASGADSRTPSGNFEIREKLKDPPWYTQVGKVIPPHSPDNILGSRWMGLWESGVKTSYGIHEALDPSDIGKYVTQGCIRMIKDDLEQLYDIVTIGTAVTIKKSNE